MTVRYSVFDGAEVYKTTTSSFRDHIIGATGVEDNLEIYLMNLGINDLQYQIDVSPGKDHNGNHVWISSTELTTLAAGENISISVSEQWARHYRFRLNDTSDQATGTIGISSPEAGDTVTINGLDYTAVSGTKSDTTEFSVDGTDTQIAIDLASSIQFDTRDGVTVPDNDVDAVANGTNVELTADEPGTDGNSIDLSEDTGGTRLTVSDSTLTGGTDADNPTLYNLFGTFLNTRG